MQLHSVTADLERFKALLAKSVIVDDDFLDPVTTHLIDAGGKYVRPLLAICSATGGTRAATQEDLLGAVAVELTHLASLYHVDVLGEAEDRRHVVTVNARYGNVIAITAGDFLMARSAGIAAELGADFAKLLAQTLMRLTRAQISEVSAAFSVDRTPDEYYRTIEGKTASLMSLSCRVGAMTSGCGREQTDALSEFGRNFGMVYQLRDDVVDFVADAHGGSILTGQDVAGGLYNLPTIFALRDPIIGEELRGILGRELNDVERERVRKMVLSTDGIAQTIAVARNYLAQGHVALALLSNETLRAAFGSLIDSLLEDLTSL